VNFRLAVDFGDERAGGINRQEIALRRCFRNRFRYAVGRENDGCGGVGDFIELGDLMCRDALMREESCGGHFREEYQYTAADSEVQQGLVNPGDVKRRDDEYAFVAAWEFAGAGKAPVLNKEPLVYEEVKMSTRSYK
jgi:succinate dehydrogenase / fumarate reductase flavoprotein subunit